MIRLCQLSWQALQGITRARLRSLLTVLGIAISSGALVSMVAFAVGLQLQFETPIKKLGLLNDVEVRPARTAATSAAPAAAAAPLLDDESLKSFAGIPGVLYAYPDFRMSQLTAEHGGRSESVMAVGVPREASLFGVFDEFLVAGQFFALGTDPQALIGERLLEDFGFDTPQQAVGKTLALTASGLDAGQPGQFELRRQRFEVRIVGVHRAPGFLGEFSRKAVLLPADLMRDLPGAGFEQAFRRMRTEAVLPTAGFAKVIVHTDGPLTAFRVEDILKKRGYEAEAVAGRIQEARRAFVFLQVLLSAVGTVGLVVAGLGIMNTLLMSVIERYQEIGIYKAIGASDGDVRVLFLTEAATLGIVGGLAGLVLARAVCWLLQWGLNLYAAGEGVDELGNLFRFPWWLLAGTVVYAVLISLLSGVYPASRAARINPIEALRGN